MPTRQPAQLILIDDLDAMSLGAGVALDALKGVEQLLETSPPECGLPPRAVAAILHCIHTTACSGWPFERRR